MGGASYKCPICGKWFLTRGRLSDHMKTHEKESEPMKRGEILDAVKKTITQDRNNRHGEPENSFPRIAEEWARYLQQRGLIDAAADLTGRTLKASDAAEMLAIFKTVRFEMQPDNPDNEHDRIGYYAIAAELRAAERERVAASAAAYRQALDQ